MKNARLTTLLLALGAMALTITLSPDGQSGSPPSPTATAYTIVTM